MSVQGKIQRVTEARQSAMPATAARARVAALLDADSFVELDGLVAAGVVCGYGAVMGSPVAVFAQDSTQQLGAVGKAHAAKIGKVYDLALKTGIPVIGIYDSRGARLDEGVGALAAYGDMLHDVNALSGVVPQIALVLGACAGVSAMLACCADFVVMAKDAELYLTAASDTKTAVSGKSDAKAAAAAGVAHIICDDDAAALEQTRRLLGRLPLNNLAPAPISDYADPAAGMEDKLRAACEDMPGANAAEIVAGVVDLDSAIELLPAFGPAAYAAIATLAGYPCGVVAAHGTLDSDSCSKIAKVVSVCDAFQIPVLTFVNTEGLSAETPAAIRDMARMAHVYAEATTAKIAVITGAAYGAAYVALAGRSAGSDYTIGWPSGVVSALSPRTAVAFLYGDDITRDKPREQVEAEYIENKASTLVAAQGGYIDDIIEPGLTRPAILAALDLLSAKRVSKNPKKHGNLPI